MERTDGELLGAFAETRDERAFEAVVRRHEALVVNVCARVLGDAQDARDAAQAVFLALSLKAARLDRSRPLAPWLHHVAYGVSVNALREREARRARERKAMERSLEATAPDEALRPVIDRELDALPDRYRRPLVLFHLEGMSLEETAAELGSPAGTVGAWLSRGRELLRDRLARRGVTALSAAGVGAVLSREAAAHAVSLGFAHAAARAAAGAEVSGRVLFLTEGAMKMLFLAKAKAAMGAVSAVAALIVANVALFSGGASLPPASKAEAAVVSAEPSLEFASAESVGEITWNSDLVGHWTLDDDKVVEASGRGAGKVVGTASWVEGKRGGAVKLDGKGGHLQLPNSELLDKVQEGSYTLAAWFKPEDVPPGKDNENNESYGIVHKAGYHLGLQYNSARKFLMTHWIAGANEPEWKGAGTWEDEYAPGAWYHVAGVVDRAAGKVAIYVNGELKSEAEFEANAKTRDYGQQPWRIGIGCPDVEHWSWPAKGLIDDVRIYGKALPAGEIKALSDKK